MEARESVEAVAGRGLRGDRYFDDRGLWNEIEADPDNDLTGASEVTFIESEALAAVERETDIAVPTGAHRRNVTTRDVPLNHLVDRQFRVGEAVCEGIQLCEPCSYMESLVGEDGLEAALVHRGGLDARIVESGEITVGDEFEW
ncbi:MOSC domain-containing protein [Halosimplex salinum]|uniref:MOSC domain-containing protein n=1 Tax=Halosimplex salinum TaxID=1710538 RepID=UPI000F4999F1